MNATPVVKIFAALLGAVLVVGVLAGGYLVTSGVSARLEPGRFEALVARFLRRQAIRMHADTRSNPVTVSDEVIADARAHFADHCSVCHGNDGSGNTEMGKGLNPRAPDMRLPATQNLSDAELFYIIENGVRFTGMPGWSTGTKEGEASSWQLVHFVRHLPRMTSDEIIGMEELNPRSRQEVRQEIEEERFLRGDDVTPPAATTTHEHTGARE